MKQYLDMLKDGKIKKVILDTDCYNEIDDQFALAYLMRSPERVQLLSVNAAPFRNERAVTPAEGMQKSYDEIFRIRKLADPNANFPIYRGSTEFMKAVDKPIDSEAADNIIHTVMNSDEKIWIVAIGAITNVASAIVKCPEIVNRAVLVWLGGNGLHWQHTNDFNLMQDVSAAQVVFNSKIPLIQIPCDGVCTEFRTTLPELEYYLGSKNKLCEYLVGIVRNYTNKPYAWSKIIWDVTAAAVLIKPQALDMVCIPVRS